MGDHPPQPQDPLRPHLSVSPDEYPPDGQILVLPDTPTRDQAAAPSLHDVDARAASFAWAGSSEGASRSGGRQGHFASGGGEDGAAAMAITSSSEPAHIDRVEELGPAEASPADGRGPALFVPAAEPASLMVPAVVPPSSAHHHHDSTLVIQESESVDAASTLLPPRPLPERDSTAPPGRVFTSFPPSDGHPTSSSHDANSSSGPLRPALPHPPPSRPASALKGQISSGGEAAPPSASASNSGSARRRPSSARGRPGSAGLFGGSGRGTSVKWAEGGVESSDPGADKSPRGRRPFRLGLAGCVDVGVRPCALSLSLARDSVILLLLGDWPDPAARIQSCFSP